MIDFHNHILPGVDDGAKTMEESIEMLKLAQAQGISDIVNTVHFQHPKMENKNTNFDYIVSVKDSLLNQMLKENIDINIHLGSEVFFNFNLLDILDNPLVTFCNGKYMLIEFQPLMFPKGYREHLYDLRMSGVIPIIAHPERYKPIQQDISIVEKLINQGCLIQIDAGSLLGMFGKKCKIISHEMIKRNMVHVVGSDAHNSRNRNFCLKEALKAMEYIEGISIDKLVNEFPQSIFSGTEIIAPEIIDSIDSSKSIFKRFKDTFFK